MANAADGRRGTPGARSAPAPGRDRARYGQLVRTRREERGFTANAVARLADLHPTQLARTEAGTRAPEDEAEVLALARALGLDEPAQDELLLAAGFWPTAFLALGHDDPALRTVAAVLAHPALPADLRERFRAAVADLAQVVLSLSGAVDGAGR